MTVEAISLALQVLITEFGAPEIIACDKEGALRKIGVILCVVLEWE